MNVLLAALLSATSLTGIWRLHSEALNETHHLVIRDEKTIELYDSNWYPYEIRKAEIKDGSFELRVFPEGRPQLMIVEGSLEGIELKGKIKIPHFQINIERDFTANRVVRDPFPPPIQHIKAIQTGKKVDILEYLLKNAPRSSGESFAEFWNETLEPRYYMFLQPFLELNLDTPGEKEEILAKLYAALDRFERVGDTGLKDKKDRVVVRVPWPAKAKSVELSRTARKVVYPPGYTPCCGDRIYGLETFIVVGVPAPKD